MRIEQDRNFIFLGSNNGVIRFVDYDDQHSMGNMIINHRLDISIDSKVTDIKFRSGKSGLITALSNGSIAFWGANENYPEFVLDCHQKSVNRILYDDSIQILFTCSSDKHIKVTLNIINYTSVDMAATEVLAVTDDA
jgi:WD40 repeat protein